MFLFKFNRNLTITKNYFFEEGVGGRTTASCRYENSQVRSEHVTTLKCR